ncbi:MAG: NAD(+) diphosphatase [Alphaproteobacteria bacterium]|nr:NAD(+) diphosphatase [Alphaproteobacteria bacterium]
MSFEAFPLGQPAFSTHIIDRAAHLRLDEGKLAELAAAPSSRAIVICRDGLVVSFEGTAARALLSIDEAVQCGANPGMVFLGLRDEAALFAMGMSRDAADALAVSDHFVVADLRGLATRGALAVADLSAIAIAKSMVNWHQRHGYCANCGGRSHMKEGGWKRVCPACKAEHFPRTDPVVIMLVTSGDNCLLGRQKQFPVGMYSCLAGFVEAAETFEDAVRREILEEAGIRCGAVSYYQTQPWPYPSSLMIGCTAEALNQDIVVDGLELEHARWFSRDEVAAMLARQHPDGLTLPHPFAIAHHLVRRWIEDKAGAK